MIIGIGKANARIPLIEHATAKTKNVQSEMNKHGHGHVRAGPSNSGPNDEQNTYTCP